MIVCDFSLVVSVADYSRIVTEQVKSLDIAMVFLNAGASIPGTIYDLSEE